MQNSNQPMNMRQTKIDAANDLGEGLEVGDKHYRAWVGPPDYYDLVGAVQFNFMTNLGLREYHTLLDIGCGSLRGGRLAITYLRPGCYFGIEPEKWVLARGIEAHLGKEFLELKKPTFSNDSDFSLTTFNREFDFLLAHSIFTHAAKRQIATCLNEARKVMTDSSIFAATIDESTEKNYEGDEWVYPGITEYTRDCISDLVEVAQLKCQFMNTPHPWGQTWCIITDPSNDLEIEKIEKGFNFSPENYLSAHAPAQRNQTVRTLRESCSPM
jgi:hypothetical protein